MVVVTLWYSHLDQVTRSCTKMAGRGERIVGYDCEFVEEPPKWLQIECPVCLLILRDPYQVTCCGKSFCRECIERVNKPCPCCKQDTFNAFPNKGLRQPLYGFKVHCSYKAEGCEWRGELGQLDNHLNLNSTSADYEVQGCPLAKVTCSFCTETMARHHLLHHISELCDKRPFTCEHCGQYKSTYDDVITYHWPVCDCHPVTCPNRCGAWPQRKDLDSHVKQVCPATVIECDFFYAGCDVTLPRSKMATHLKADLLNHFSLSHKKQQEDLKQKTEEIEDLKKQMSQKDKALHALHAEIEKLTRQMRILSSQTTMFPVDFQIYNPERCGIWRSPHFYTHERGYKLCLEFYKQVSWYWLGVRLLKGGHDDQLEWPLVAVVNVHVLDYGKHLPHKKITFTTHNGRVKEGDRANSYSCDIVSESVEGLKNLTDGGILYIRVISVRL